MIPRPLPRPRNARRVVLTAGERGTVLVLRGEISDGAEDDLRRALGAVIDGGAVAVVLDLTEVETLSSSARKLVASAASTLADRGGVLLGWTTNDLGGERSHVMRELHGAVLAGPEPGAHGRRTR